MHGTVARENTRTRLGIQKTESVVRCLMKNDLQEEEEIIYPFKNGDMVQMRIPVLRMPRFSNMPKFDVGFVVGVSKSTKTEHFLVNVIWQKHKSGKTLQYRHIRLKLFRT